MRPVVFWWMVLVLVVVGLVWVARRGGEDA